MQTLEEPELNCSEVRESEISGFDAGHRSILREPTLYVSIIGVFIISWLALNNTPTVFWIVSLALSALCAIAHILAERYIFSAKKENKGFSTPYEGMFVVTFGSILPGFSLLSYAVYSLFSCHPDNILLEAGKIILLLSVPALNLSVWAAIRSHYLRRPRLVGMMNGIALGLSASWTAIWLKVCFFSTTAASCKFGWMFLLCVSPFLMLGALMLLIDLCKKAEASIARIAGAFAAIGVFLSVLFVFIPAIHVLVIQSALAEARKISPSELDKTIAYIRTITTPEDLRPSEYAVSGFGLGAMLIPNRGLESGQKEDKDLFFRITGTPCREPGQAPYNPQTWKPEEEKDTSTFLGRVRPDLFLAKSVINGNLDASTLSGFVDWNLTFHNDGASSLEPRAEIALPPGAVVSRVTHWINDQPHDGTLVPVNIQNPTYKTPILISMSGKEKVILRGLEVPPNEGELKIRIRIAVPLNAGNGLCSVRLPKIIESNFIQPRRLHIHLTSRSEFISTDSSAVEKKNLSYSFDEILKSSNPEEAPDCIVSIKGLPASDLIVEDQHSPEKQAFIRQQEEKYESHGPKELLVVLDTSAQMRRYLPELQKALASIPARLKPVIYLARTSAQHETITCPDFETAQKKLCPYGFEGGQDNSIVLREALENGAEKHDRAVLWIHGPQPISKSSISAAPLDLANPITLYDFEVQAGPNVLIRSLGLQNPQHGCTHRIVNRASNVENDLCALFSGWNTVISGTRICRSRCSQSPGSRMIQERASSEQVTALWARDEVLRLNERGQARQAESLACKYHIVTPVSQTVLGVDAARMIVPNFEAVESTKVTTYVGNTAITTKAPEKPPTIGGIESSAQVSRTPSVHEGSGLVGAPVDPRYGQSNEIGQLADYGYDTARDVSRAVTMLSALVSFFICFSIIRRRKENGFAAKSIFKGIGLAFAIPTAVHLIGTFMINNFGGLGGGL